MKRTVAADCHLAASGVGDRGRYAAAESGGKPAISTPSTRLLREGCSRIGSERDRHHAAYIAATNGNAAVLRRLLDAGAESRPRMRSGDTLLMAAVRAGNVDAVAAAARPRAAVNAADPQYGHTALMWAVRRNDNAAITGCC